MSIIEISQDGAGLALNGDETSFYTQDVATCIVYAFIGASGFLVIHDTGQLSIQSICSHIKEVGNVKKLICAQNSAQETKEQTKVHRERRKRIAAIIKFKGTVEKVDVKGGAIAFTCDGGWTISHLSDITQIPDRDRRLMINNLNNLFSPRNSKSIPVDLQYRHGDYTQNPALIFSTEKMKARAEAESKKGDNDYYYFYQQGINLGLF